MVGWESYVLNRPQIPCQLALPICIYFFSWKNINNVGKMIIVVTLILALCAALFAGRRSVAASLLFFVLISIIIYLRRKKMKFCFNVTFPFAFLHKNGLFARNIRRHLCGFV